MIKDFRVIYVKYMLEDENFDNGVLIWNSIIENLDDYIIIDDDNKNYKYLVMDITRYVHKLGSISRGITKFSSWSGVEIVNNGDIFNLKGVYRYGDSLFEASLYDRLILLSAKDKTFKGILYDDLNLEVKNVFVEKLFNKLGLGLSDYNMMFYGYIDKVDMNITRNKIIKVSCSGFSSLLDMVNINLLPAIVKEYNLGGNFSVIKPYSQMMAWEIVVDIFIKTFDLEYTLDDIKKDLNVRIEKGKIKYNKESEYLVYLDNEFPFIELKDGERVVARVELILLQASAFTTQQMKLFENTIVKAKKIVSDVAVAVNGYVYDDVDGVVYFRVLHNVNPPRVYFDDYMDIESINRGTSIKSSVSGLIGTSSFIPAGFKEIEVPDKNTIIYMNSYKIKKYGLDIKQVAPVYGFKIKNLKENNFSLNNNNKIEKKKDKIKILVYAYWDENYDKEVYYTTDGWKNMYEIDKDFAEILYNKLSIEQKFDVTKIVDKVKDNVAYDQYVRDDYDLLLVIRGFFTKNDKFNIGYYTSDAIGEARICDRNNDYEMVSCDLSFYVNKFNKIYVIGSDKVENIKNLAKGIANFIGNADYKKLAKEDNKLFYNAGVWGGELKDYSPYSNSEGSLNIIEKYKYSQYRLFRGAYESDINSIFSGSSFWYNKINVLTIVPMSITMTYKFMNSGIEATKYGILEWGRYEISKYNIAETIKNRLVEFLNKKGNIIKNKNVLSPSEKGQMLQESRDALANYMLAYYDSVNSNAISVSMNLGYLIPQLRLFDAVYLNFKDLKRLYNISDISYSLAIHSVAKMSITLKNERFPICDASDTETYDKWYDLFYNDDIILNRVHLYKYNKDAIKKRFDDKVKSDLNKFNIIYNAVNEKCGDKANNVMAIILLHYNDSNWGLVINRLFNGLEISEIEEKWKEGKAKGMLNKVGVFCDIVNEIYDKYSLNSFKEFMTYYEAGYIKAMDYLRNDYSGGEDVLSKVIEAFFYSNLLYGYNIKNIEFNASALRLLKKKIQEYKDRKYIFDNYIWSPIGVYDYGDVKYIYINKKNIVANKLFSANSNIVHKRVYKWGDVVLDKSILGVENLLEVLKKDMGNDFNKIKMDSKNKAKIDDYIKNGGNGIYEIYMNNLTIIDVKLKEGFKEFESPHMSNDFYKMTGGL